MKILKLVLAISIVAILTQSCEDQADATYMEDYLIAEEFTPTWKDEFPDINAWTKLDNDGDDMKLGNDANATWEKGDNGLNVEAAGGWHHRIIRDEITGDFTVEFKIKMNSSNSEYPKAGIFVGETGGDAPKLWLSLDNNGGGHSVAKFLPGSTNGDWYNFGVDGFDCYQWQVIKAVKEGNKFTVYINDAEVLTEEGDYVANIVGKFGLSVEGCNADIEYVSVNGWTDNFENFDKWEPKASPSSTWTTNNDGLHVVALGGWHHRIFKETVPANFTVEYKVKLDNPNSTYPKAGLVIGELGKDAPSFILGLDHFDAGHSIVKFIQGRPRDEWQNFGVPDLDVKKWQTIRLKRVDNAIYIYMDSERVYFEQGDYITSIQGKLGLYVEGCDADFEFISYKED